MLGIIGREETPQVRTKKREIKTILIPDSKGMMHQMHSFSAEKIFHLAFQSFESTLLYDSERYS